MEEQCKDQADRERADRRVTVRFRYECDRDLIDALEEAPNASKLIREALRSYLEERHADADE